MYAHIYAERKKASTKNIYEVNSDDVCVHGRIQVC